MKLVLRIAALATAFAVVAVGFMYWSAVREPLVRRTIVAMGDWPAGAVPVRVAFLTDIHVAGPDMPPDRLAEIVAQVNRLAPDVVLLAGDFVSDKRTATRRYSVMEAVAPLERLRARYGAIAVLGNHDHWRNATQTKIALERASVRLLDNDAFTAGPLRIGGVDDAFTDKDDVTATLRAMRSGPGSRLILTHSPDIAPEIPRDVTLLLAGHTHCGQIRLPLIGAFSYMSDYGERFGCGLARLGKLRIVTSAGLGTSILPLRLWTRPEIWLIELRPVPRAH